MGGGFVVMEFDCPIWPRVDSEMTAKVVIACDSARWVSGPSLWVEPASAWQARMRRSRVHAQGMRFRAATVLPFAPARAAPMATIVAPAFFYRRHGVMPLPENPAFDSGRAIAIENRGVRRAFIRYRSSERGSTLGQ